MHNRVLESTLETAVAYCLKEDSGRFSVSLYHDGRDEQGEVTVHDGIATYDEAVNLAKQEAYFVDRDDLNPLHPNRRTWYVTVRKDNIPVWTLWADGTISGDTTGYLQESGSGLEAYGVKGMNSLSWRKTFKSQASFEKWLERQDGNVEVHGVSYDGPSVLGDTGAYVWDHSPEPEELEESELNGGYTVLWEPDMGGWMASVHIVGGGSEYLGPFDTNQEAHYAASRFVADNPSRVAYDPHIYDYGEYDNYEGYFFEGFDITTSTFFSPLSDEERRRIQQALDDTESKIASWEADRDRDPNWDWNGEKGELLAFYHTHAADLRSYLEL